MTHFCEMKSKCFVSLPCWVTAPCDDSCLSARDILLLLCSAQLLHAQNFFSFIPQHVLPRSVATRKTYCERDHTPRSPRTPLGNLLSTFRGNIVVTLRVETSNPNWIYRPCRRRHSYISKFQKRLSTGAGSYSRRWVA